MLKIHRGCPKILLYHNPGSQVLPPDEKKKKEKPSSGYHATHSHS